VGEGEHKNFIPCPPPPTSRPLSLNRYVVVGVVEVVVVIVRVGWVLSNSP